MPSSFASAVVASDGSLISQHNIGTCEKINTGLYKLSYSRGFSAGPGAQATPWGNGGFISLSILAENLCEILIEDARGAPTDAGFTFLVPALA